MSPERERHHQKINQKESGSTKTSIRPAFGPQIAGKVNIALNYLLTLVFYVLLLLIGSYCKL